MQRQWYWLGVSLPWKTVCDASCFLKLEISTKATAGEKQVTLNEIVPVIEGTWHGILQVVSGKD